MYKIKKPTSKAPKAPVLYNIVEDYSEFDPPGNVTVCAMTEPEQVAEHARILGESYEIPSETVAQLLSQGGVYVYPPSGPLVTRGLFACRVDRTGVSPKLTWVLDVMQFAEVEQLVKSYGLSREEAAYRVFLKTLPPELRQRMEEKNLGLDYGKLERAVARGGDIKYIDFRKDWSPHFKRLCIMPDGKLVETGGLAEFAALQGITVLQARRLVEEGGTLEVGDDILACQVVNGQPVTARFSAGQYATAKGLMAERGLHLMDALSEVGLSDPAMMRTLSRLEGQIRAEPRRS